MVCLHGNMAVGLRMAALRAMMKMHASRRSWLLMVTGHEQRRSCGRASVRGPASGRQRVRRCKLPPACLKRRWCSEGLLGRLQGATMTKMKWCGEAEDEGWDEGLDHEERPESGRRGLREAGRVRV